MEIEMVTIIKMNIIVDPQMVTNTNMGIKT